MKPGHSAAMKPAHSAAVEPAHSAAATPAMRAGVGEIWLAECGNAQQNRCDCQSPSYPGPGSAFI
jgi:hypothetical protein